MADKQTNFTPLTMGALRAAVAKADPRHDDKLVKAWLPGSTIRLNGEFFFSKVHDAVLIEGNLDAGSALESS